MPITYPPLQPLASLNPQRNVQSMLTLSPYRQDIVTTLRSACQTNRSLLRGNATTLPSESSPAFSSRSIIFDCGIEEGVGKNEGEGTGAGEGEGADASPSSSPAMNSPGAPLLIIHERVMLVATCLAWIPGIDSNRSSFPIVVPDGWSNRPGPVARILRKRFPVYFRTLSTCRMAPISGFSATTLSKSLILKLATMASRGTAPHMRNSPRPSYFPCLMSMP